MTLLNKEAKKVYGLTTFVGGAGMSTAGYKRGTGWAYVFNVDGYKVVKNVFFDGCETYYISGKNIIDKIFMNVLDMSEVEAINENLRVKVLSNIMDSDLMRVKKIMNTNKKGFMFFMNNLISKGFSKDLAFANVVKDYYSKNFQYSMDTKSIIKVMIKYGYEFTSMIEANKLIR
jgi:hypothetical protein